MAALPNTNRHRALSADLLAYVLSFATDDVDQISSLITLLATRDTAGAPHKDDDDAEEQVFRSLCLLHWQSVSSASFETEWKPKLSRWKAVYRVLQTWVPREGFYSVLEAAPWGLLLRLQFEAGKFVGYLLWPHHEEAEEGGDTTGSSGFRSIRVLSVTFSHEGNASQATLLNQRESDNAGGIGEEISIMPIKVPKYTEPGMVLPGWSLRTIVGTGTTLRLIQRTNARMTDSLRNELDATWNHSTAADPNQMLQTLWQYSALRSPGGVRHLTLNWVDGPSRDDSFQYLDGMPVIRPGLYSGVYAPDVYGKFKREVILIEYRKYELGESNSTEEATKWNTIQTEIFNAPEHTDGHGFYQSVKTFVTKSSSRSIVFVVGRKVTGDYHVPMRCITFGALVHPTLPLQNPPATATDRGHGEHEYFVKNAWAGWGTMAFPGFQRPVWANGTLVQVEPRSASIRNGRGNEAQSGIDQFGFIWESDHRGEETSILTRMTEQDEFPWFS